MNRRTCRRFRTGLGSATIVRRFVRSSSLLRLDYAMTAKFPRFLSGRNWRLSMVRRCSELRVASGSLHMLVLCGYRWNMPIMFRRFLLRRWTRVDPSIATVVTHSINRGGVDRCVVDVVDVGDVHIHDGAVIEEMSIVPASARKARAEITESIIDPAVKPYCRSPVTFMKNECRTAPTPPARSPQKADFGSQHPRARHPEVVGGVVIPIPITGCPEITIARANRLLIHRQCRWTNCDSHSELPE